MFRMNFFIINQNVYISLLKVKQNVSISHDFYGEEVFSDCKNNKAKLESTTYNDILFLIKYFSGVDALQATNNRQNSTIIHR